MIMTSGAIQLLLLCSIIPTRKENFQSKKYAEKWWDRTKGISSAYGQYDRADCTNFVSKDIDCNVAVN